MTALDYPEPSPSIRRRHYRVNRLRRQAPEAAN